MDKEKMTGDEDDTSWMYWVKFRPAANQCIEVNGVVCPYSRAESSLLLKGFGLTHRTEVNFSQAA